ncbi:hypothetical protein ITP53_38385 [Nonomuraea sp. K274]|uniref:Uncharacterized protein n=1 Tax=Nonomuraea cypriaca TaxID=1187855 RepID=A0A931F4U4_9ACTN|nr:hypothetical protein [Nonomuraea cypriaca]MBF8191466.1 hypothetical protein [Nonomuraea cypriaca]
MRPPPSAISAAARPLGVLHEARPMFIGCARRVSASCSAVTNPSTHSRVVVPSRRLPVQVGHDLGTAETLMPAGEQRTEGLREFKNDDLQAFRALKSGLRRHGADASAAERAIALCLLIDLSMVLGEPTDPWLADLHAIELTTDDRRHVESELGHLAGLQEWLP